MSSKQVTKTIYTIDSHPNKQKVFEWVRNNWHDLNQYDIDELIESLVIKTLVTMCLLMRRY